MDSKRDSIGFYPADPSNAKTLTPAQVEQFNEHGYLASLAGLNRLEAQESRKYFDDLLQAMSEFQDGRNAYAIMNYQIRCRGIWDLAMRPLFLNYVEDLIGPDFVCWTTHYFCKLPGDPKRVPWHQDATYWPVRPTKTVTIWLAIDDVDEENAPMQFLPGSHRQGAIDYDLAKGEVVLQQEISDVSQYETPYSNILTAGQISIHASTLIHGSEPNPSSRRRCGLTLRYIPSDCGVIGNAGRVLRGGIPCRGDPGNWKANERPEGDDLRLLHQAYID